MAVVLKTICNKIQKTGDTMIKYNNCIRCNSENIDKIKVNSIIHLNYPEEKNFGRTTQKVITPTDAIVCKECGHIEFFIDWDK